MNIYFSLNFFQKLRRPEFSKLKYTIHTMDIKLQNLIRYVDHTWFNSSIWEPKNICCYKRLVRTNNDTEGYHRRLDTRCGPKPPLYKLLEVLYEEARLVDVTCKLVSSETVSIRKQIHRTHETQAKLLKMWEDYDEDKITREELLSIAGDCTPF